MITFRFLQLTIASTFLLVLVKGQDATVPEPYDRPSFNNFTVELCDLPCANNGRCVSFDSDKDGVLDPQCLCNTAFQGDLCETPRTCSLACENGGTCSLGRAWWLGEPDENPEKELDFFKEVLFRCSLDGDGDCMYPDMAERCNCPSGTRGELCETTCEKTCLNGAECVFWGSEQRCRCPNNFYGDQCENQCNKVCQNGGICLPSPTGTGGVEEQCLCPAGFEGDLCETEIPCPQTCQNNGVCKFYDNGWFSEELEENPEYLQSLLERCIIRDLPIAECIGGFEGEPGSYCECPSGTLGRNCEFVCDLECQNGSTCEFQGRQNNFCRCEPGFAGDLCQFQCTKECANGGVCTSDGTTESCQCSPYYEGDACENERTCDKTCQNGGNCVMNERYRNDEKYFQECISNNLIGCPGVDDIQQCNCTSEFVGSDCGTPCPCQNGGTCGTRYWYRKLQQFVGGENGNDQQQYYDDVIFPEEEEAGGYFCQCPFGYYGQDCEFKYDSENCALDCQNGGYCRADLGWQDYQDAPMKEEQAEVNFNENNNNNNNDQNGRQSSTTSPSAPFNSNGGIDNNYIGGPLPTAPPVSGRPFEYCVCPDGFRGVSCEVEIDACDNQCQNGGVCTTEIDSVRPQGAGNRALQSSGATNGEGPAVTSPSPTPISKLEGVCSCPDGYSGEFCERKACGSGYCSHGGTCIVLPSGQTTSAGDDYLCDCSTSALEDVVGIGRNCDAVVYNSCPWVNTKLNPNEDWACGGFGRCYNEGSSPRCSCGNRESFGPRCEFDSTNPKDVAWGECSLQCSNDGICLKGPSKPIAEIFIPFVEATKKSGLFDYPTPDFEYCYCPDGIFGVQCDMQYDICGNKDHICFHGSKCTNSGGEWGCDCAGTESAGLYCQYKATDDCGDSDPETFCTNDATCSLDSNSNAVCACSEGWEGTKCETEIKLAAPAGGGDNNWSSATAAGTLVSILSLAMLSFALIMA